MNFSISTKFLIKKNILIFFALLIFNLPMLYFLHLEWLITNDKVKGV